MKFTFTLLRILTLSFHTSFSQNIGVGTSTPNPSAQLHIESSNKGLLIPQIDLSSAIFPGEGPATSLLVFNTNPSVDGGRGFYFNNGTPSSPEWIKLMDADDLSVGADNDWLESGATIYNNNSDIGIGTSSVDAKVEVFNNSSLSDPHLLL
ncbi:MAG: hypothetical protein AAGK97_12985, partial [Bacteroidota bacterium]